MLGMTACLLDSCPSAGRLRSCEASCLHWHTCQLPHTICSESSRRDGGEPQVTCLAVCPELDLVLSGSADGAVLMHTLGEGR